jgi:6-pyruvoyltetrahydropterin/6-carboxytetrahydropterin synthase
MANIRITKTFEFEMAHALWDYDGLCSNIHGHSYKLFVTIIGKPNNKPQPKQGMVIDFGELKKVVNQEIIDKYDHALVVNNKAPVNLFEHLNQMYDRYYVKDYQPTCENLLIEFVEILKNKLPGEASLFSLKLQETSSSFAEWFAADNY